MIIVVIVVITDLKQCVHNHFFADLYRKCMNNVNYVRKRINVRAVVLVGV